MQLITGDICPGRSGELYLYKFAGAYIVCREAPYYTVHREANEYGKAVARLMDPDSEHQCDLVIRASRLAFERWLVEEGKPWGEIRGNAFSRAQIASVWGRVLPMGLGPATLRLHTSPKVGTLLGVEDRLGQAVACCPAYPHEVLTSQVPDLEVLMRKILED